VRQRIPSPSCLLPISAAIRRMTISVMGLPKK
jgi:hypothetical protein